MIDKTDKALEYHRMIAPLLAPGLEQAERRALREHVLLTENISERTLRRLMEKFRNGQKRKRNAIEQAPKTGSRLLQSLEKAKKERLHNKQSFLFLTVYLLNSLFPLPLAGSI